MSKTADVIIVGSGVIGCATAYYLAQKGTSVIVLDRDESIGNGGSARNGGGVRQSGRDPRELPLAMYAVKICGRFFQRSLNQCGISQRGQPGGLKTAVIWKSQGLTDRATHCGLDVKMIDGKEVREINPFLSDEVIGASWCATDGHANPLLTTLGYYRAARRLGVQFFTGEEVVELQKVKGKLRKVVTQKNVYEGDKVIVAAGYASRKLLGTVGIDVPMSNDLIEALVTEAEPKMFGQMLGTADADFYGHQTDHGSFVFGGASGFETVNKDNGHNMTSGITAPCICRGIMKYIPKLANAKIVRTWAGYEDVCIDGVPVLGNVDEVPVLIVACAFTGHGFGISPIVGKLLAERHWKRRQR